VTALYQPTVGDYPSSAELNTLIPISAIKSADQTVNNSATLVNDTSLVWAMNANVKYRFAITVVYSSNTTANFKFALAIPSGARLDFGYAGYVVGGTNTALFQGDVNDTATAGTPFAVAGIVGIDASLFIHGIVTVVGAGNLQFKWAQNTANVSNTIVRGGSSGTLQQIA
jgi:hypothetical protein